MNLNNASHRRAELASSARPFQSASKSADAAGSNPADKTLDLAKQHRDRLLNYQVENAKRTHIIDEAADFETPTAGLSMWSSPVERAAQLKKQQKILREQEWNAKPEYEKRRVVASIDLVGGKVVKRMADVEKPTHEDLDVGDKVTDMGSLDDHDGSKGTFSKNPLIGNLIRPIWKTKGKETDSEAWKEDKENQPRQSTWRRVQDDNDDNEEVILNGGVYGGREDDRILGEDEHAYG